MMMMIKTAMERHSTISKCSSRYHSGFVTSDGRVDTTSVTCEGYFVHDKLVLGSCTRLQHSHEHNDNDNDGGVRHESTSLAWDMARENRSLLYSVRVSPRL